MTMREQKRDGLLPVQNSRQIKRSKGFLSQDNEHLRKVMNLLKTASWELCFKDNRLFWSDEVFEIFNISPKESLDYDQFLSLILPEDRPYVEQKWQAAVKGEPYDIEHRILVGDQIKWLRERAVIEFDAAGAPVQAFGIVEDITDRKDTESMLDKAEINYRIVADFTYDWEWWQSPDKSYRYVSPSCERITGYPAAAFIEDNGLLEKIMVHEDLEKWKFHKNKAFENYGLREIQFRIKRADGNIRWIEHACQPVYTQENHFMGIRASNRDITARKQTKLELEKTLVEMAQLKKNIEEESLILREEIKLQHNHKNIIGNSNAIQYVLFKVEQVAETDSTVMVLGETGTGKELIARAIHHNSQRKNRPLIKINCATLPDNLIESELFGHEKGAFTGADARQKGRFEIAHGSTLFLDEIAELPIHLQAKLLRVIESGEFERLGSYKTIKTDVRIIAATNRDLEKDVRKGRFRKDLWFRLNVFPITIPPLRDRLEDIPLIVQHYMDIFAKKMGKGPISITKKTIKVLENYAWPGNVRELENILERSVVSTSGSQLNLLENLDSEPREILDQLMPLADMERDYITRILQKTNWKVSGKNSASEILELDRSTLRFKMRKLGIQKPV